MNYHPRVDIDHWRGLFPLADFEKQEGSRRFLNQEPDDPIDLWKAQGRMIDSPANLAVLEQVRERAAQTNNLGTAIPVDIFLWAIGSPEQPFLTKLGGVPHREKNKPWPRSRYGQPMTFVVQFCFLDSKDLFETPLPGDLMLVFWRDDYSHSGSLDDVHIEWSRRELSEPLSKNECPSPGFPVPELAGVIHRTNEYPESENVFWRLGHYQHWLISTTQSTKIGQAAWFIQQDPRQDDEVLLCTFNSLQPEENWPFINRESSTISEPDFDFPMFGDVGCIYFLMNQKGRLRCVFDCY